MKQGTRGKWMGSEEIATEIGGWEELRKAFIEREDIVSLSPLEQEEQWLQYQEKLQYSLNFLSRFEVVKVTHRENGDKAITSYYQEE